METSELIDFVNQEIEFHEHIGKNDIEEFGECLYEKGYVNALYYIRGLIKRGSI